MTTASETRRLMASAGDQWFVPLMDFVDDFRRRRDTTAIQQPFTPHHDRLDALLAAVIEALCDETAMDVPRWVLDVPPAPRAWFVSGMESLKALALIQSPLPFRMRRIFVLDNFLSRV